MNITCLNKNVHFKINSYLSAFRIEPVLYKFCSIILATDQIKEASNENRLVAWLNNEKQKSVPHDVKDYRNIVYDVLGLSQKHSLQVYKNRVDIATLYARILDHYIPDDKGGIKQPFNYHQLVVLIKKVFEKHINKDQDLIYSGLDIDVDGLRFYARLSRAQIFIFSAKCELIGKGTFGSVGKIFEIASHQLLALKWANKMDGAVERINREMSVLQNLHAIADFEGFNVAGLQDPPLATIHLPMLSGFLGTLYGVSVFAWCEEVHSNEERIAMCKAIVNAFVSKENAGYWQGDLKLENILTSQNGVVLIDWDGSLPYLQAYNNLDRPDAATPKYVNYADLKKLDLITFECEMGRTDELSLGYQEAAKSMELFSLAIVLFYVLFEDMPFEMRQEEEYEADFPYTEYGICDKGWAAVIKKRYDWKIVLFIGKMLNSDPQNRYKLNQVVDFWRTI